MNQKRKINNDVFIGFVLAAIAAFFYHEATKIHPAAAQFPKIMLALLFIMSVILMGLGIRKTLKPELWGKSDTGISFKIIRTPLVVFFIIAGYLVLMKFTGFFISTIIFIPVIMLYYGVKSIRTILLTNIGLNLFVYLVFIHALKVMLP